MTIKIRGDRAPPPAEKHWRKINEGMSIEVAGLRYRRDEVAVFIEGAAHAGIGRFGVEARREPNNPHSANGTATAVDGWWRLGSLPLSTNRKHLGYLPQWASHECILGKAPEPAIFLELYSAYLGFDGFVDVDIIVHVEMSESEAREIKAEAAADELRRRSLPGLKILARMAAMSGRPENPGEMAVMRGYVEARARDLGLDVRAGDINRIVEAATGLAPSDQAVMTSVRNMATDDAALEAMFRAGIAMGRVDGVESPEEIKFLSRVLATARRRRAKAT
ncbi:hypothetical protein [Tardiphaga sp.]|jgi:hypothetical protein|uniref:hypothetical protein n=1 Tax=Tardiphaga sp. TaxID=1926292 RepID=UPI0037DA53D1